MWNKTLKLLIIGAGSIGTRHAENAKALGAEVTHMPYRSLGAHWASDIGAVDGAVIATATKVRGAVIAPLAAHGVPLYIEKPLTVTPREVSEVSALLNPVADRSMVGFMMRYHPTVRALVDADLSDLYAARFEIGHDVTQWRRNWTFAGSYAADPVGGGVLLDLCHEIDIAHLLFPNAPFASARCLGHRDYPRVDFRTALRFEGDVDLTVAMDYLNPISHRNITLRGTDISCDIDLLTGTRAGAGPRLPALDGFDRNTMFSEAMADFLRLIQGKPPQNTIAPTFAATAQSCQIIAQAWAARQFVGHIKKDP